MPTLETQLPAGIGAGRQARAFVHDLLQASDLTHVRDVVALLSTELVNNAVEHAVAGPTLRVTPDAHTVRVEVDDPSVDAPILEVPDELSEHGRGLLLVARLADDWGFEIESAGKTVWFEIDASVEGGLGVATEAGGEDQRWRGRRPSRSGTLP